MSPGAGSVLEPPHGAWFETKHLTSLSLGSGDTYLMVLLRASNAISIECLALCATSLN